MSDSSSLRLKPWFHLTNEEKNYIIYQAYVKRVLRSSDLQQFLRQNRLNNFSTWTFPLIGFPLLKLSLFNYLEPRFLATRPKHQFLAVQALVTAAAWVFWLNYSPVYRSLLRKQEDVLNVVEQRVGIKVLEFNDVLPRIWTEAEVNRKTQRLYNERNGAFAGYLYPQEESAVPLVDLSSWPKDKKRFEACIEALRQLGQQRKPPGQKLGNKINRILPSLYSAMSSHLMPGNPFAVEQLIDDTVEKEIIYQQILGFAKAKETADMLCRLQNNSPIKGDFALRDVIVAKRYPQEFVQPSLFVSARSHFQENRSIDSKIKNELLVKECNRKKHLFWKRYSTIYSDDKEKWESRKAIKEAVRDNVLPTQLAFFAIGLGISGIIKLYKNPISYQIVSVLTGFFLGKVYGEFKFSNEIFQSIPPLSNTAMETERQNIINYCFSVDIDLMTKTFMRQMNKDIDTSSQEKEKDKAKGSN